MLTTSQPKMDLARAQEKLKELFFTGILRPTPSQPPKLKDNDKGKGPIHDVRESYEVKERKPLPPFVPWYRLEAQKEKERAREEAKKKGIEIRTSILELSISSGSSGSVSRNSSPTDESTTPPTTRTTSTRTSLDTSKPSTTTNTNDSKPKTKSESESDSKPNPKPQSTSMTLTPILPGLNISTTPSALDKAMLKSHNISTIIILSTSPPSEKDLDTFHALKIKHNHIPLENHAVQDLLKHFGSISDYINANAPRELRTSFSLKDVENRYIIEEDKAERDAARARACGHEGTGPSREKGYMKDSSNNTEEEEEGSVLLYCNLDDGQSVAITVLAAFIMRQFGVLTGPVLKFIETRMGLVELSPHFVRELDIWVGVQWKGWTFDRMRGRVRKPTYEDFLVGTAMALAVDCVDGPFGV